MKNIAKVNDVLQRAGELEEAGSWGDVISLLTQRNRQKENIEIESRLLKARHRSFLEKPFNAPSVSWPNLVADMFPDESGVPEIQASELNAAVIASAIQHHGSLLVRGLIREEEAENVRQAMDAAMEARASVEDHITDSAAPWYKPFSVRADPALRIDRSVTENQSLALAVDSPRTLFRHLEALDRAGFIDAAREYFNDHVAISARKSTIRRTPPNAPTAWHQDGIYFGKDSRALNIWTAYSPCGVEAASMDFITQPFTDIIRPDGGEFYDQSVGHDIAAGFGEDSIARPEFNTGDAILFDHLTLHRTGVDKNMTKLRYAIEMWFFSASTYPDNQVPLFV
jgi:hypothetical protein